MPGDPLGYNPGGAGGGLSVAQVNALISARIRILHIGIATAAGVAEGAGLNVESSNAWFFGVVLPTVTAPRIVVTVPIGRTLLKVYDSVDGDLTSHFARDTGTQIWRSTINFADQSYILTMQVGTP